MVDRHQKAPVDVPSHLADGSGVTASGVGVASATASAQSSIGRPATSKASGAADPTDGLCERDGFWGLCQRLDDPLFIGDGMSMITK